MKKIIFVLCILILTFFYSGCIQEKKEDISEGCSLIRFEDIVYIISNECTDEIQIEIPEGVKYFIKENQGLEIKKILTNRSKKILKINKKTGFIEKYEVILKIISDEEVSIKKK